MKFITHLIVFFIIISGTNYAQHPKQSKIDNTNLLLVNNNINNKGTDNIEYLNDANKTKAKEDFKIVGYLPYWRWEGLNSIDYNGVTHLYLAFANPDSKGNLIFKVDINKLKTAIGSNDVELIISIGGGGISNVLLGIYKTLLKDENRPSFIQKLVEFVEDNDLDGIDIDLENEAVMIPEYNNFVIEVTKQMKSLSKITTVALPQWTGDYVSDSTLKVLDWINIMAYDETGPWTPDTPGPHSSMEKMYSDFDYFSKTRGVDGSKLVIGLPFYGYEFVSKEEINGIGYCDILSQNNGADTLDEVNGNLFYNGKPTLEKKTKYAMENSGGIMIWELGQDCCDNNSLLLLINQIIDSSYTQSENLSIDECGNYLNLNDK